jgi:hypothetical protein
MTTSAVFESTLNSGSVECDISAILGKSSQAVMLRSDVDVSVQLSRSINGPSDLAYGSLFTLYAGVPINIVDGNVVKVKLTKKLSNSSYSIVAL